MTSATTSVANRVFGEMKKNDPTCSFDPAIIMVIVEALQILLPMLIELCDKTTNEVPSVCGETLSHGGFAYRVARRQLRRKLGWRDYYAAGGDKLLNAVLAVGMASSPEEVAQVYAEVSR